MISQSSSLIELLDELLQSFLLFPVFLLGRLADQAPH